MKKCAVFFCCFAVAAVVAAVWFSPLCFAGGHLGVYANNAETATLDGALCYFPEDTVRVDMIGGEETFALELKKLCAVVVKTVELDGLTLVYAYSPRVCGRTLALGSGEKYNVMAAKRGDRIAIGTPVLEGSY